jgi:hypothetical protein
MGILDLIDMAEDRNKWRALVKTVMGPQVPIEWREILD